MPQISVTLSPALRDEVDGAARRFNSSRGELARRALEHYVRHIEELETVSAAARRDAAPDWGAIKTTLRRAHCPFGDCPFADSCPAEICPL